jgi:hypothetical protein
MNVYVHQVDDGLGSADAWDESLGGSVANASRDVVYSAAVDKLGGDGLSGIRGSLLAVVAAPSSRRSG